MIKCHVIRQSNGRVAVWSSVVDNWIAVDLSDAEFVAMRVEQAKNDARDSARRTLANHIRPESDLEPHERKLLREALAEAYA